LTGRRESVSVRRHLELDDDFGQNPRFLAGVERVIDGFLDAREQRFSRVVEAEQVAVLGKEFGDGDLPLAGSHFGRG
jgi:hypothetical protein